MILYWSTLAVIGAVVLVLAGYLIAIAWTLWMARVHVRDLADGLERVAERTDGVDVPVAELRDVMSRTESSFAAVRKHLAAAATTFER